MTTLAAIQGDGWVVVGYDSKVMEDNRSYVLPRDNSKLVKNGPYLLSAAGDMRAINLLAFTFKPPIPPVNELADKLDRFITNKFIPALKACLEENGYGKEEQDSYFLVVINATVYEIGTDFSWARDQEGIYSIGSGSAYALGAIYSQMVGKKRTLPSCRSIVKNAMLIAAKLDPGTGEPVTTVVQQA
jgi:ATP-dependent protease HslVU (ClpYQ) peptidase subunit